MWNLNFIIITLCHNATNDNIIYTIICVCCGSLVGRIHRSRRPTATRYRSTYRFMVWLANQQFYHIISIPTTLTISSENTWKPCATASSTTWRIYDGKFGPRVPITFSSRSPFAFPPLRSNLFKVDSLFGKIPRRCQLVSACNSPRMR